MHSVEYLLVLIVNLLSSVVTGDKNRDILTAGTFVRNLGLSPGILGQVIIIQTSCACSASCTTLLHRT